MIIETKVAMALTTSVTTSVSRVLQMSWEKTSWPMFVVPSRCAEDGPWLGGKIGAWGSYGAISPGNAATNAITSRITAPTVALRLPATTRRNLRGGWRTATAVLSSPAVSSVAVASAAISSLPRPRIENGCDEVRDQHADEDRERVEQEQALHQRQIVIGRGRVEEIAEARIREQVLDHDRTAEHVAELHREPGEVGQDRVAPRVVEHHAPRRQSLGAAHLHVVVGDRRDHVVAHRVHPQAGGHDHQAQPRQEGVFQHIPDERRR